MVGLLSGGSLTTLRALTLRSSVDCHEAVRAAGKLRQLKHLHLAAPAASLAALTAALPGLPHLTHLTLRPLPSPGALDNIPAQDIPALSILVVLGDPCRPLDAATAAASGEAPGTPGEYLRL